MTANAGPAAELDRAADVVHECRREQQVGAQPRMELRRLAAERRDADRVLQQPAGVGVVVVGRRRVGGEVAVGEHRLHGRGQRRVRDLGDEEVEEARDLVGIAADRRRERRRVDVGRLERAHVELQPVLELLDASEHAHRVAFAEAAVEQLDVLPHAGLDAPRRVDELEREVGGTALRPELPLRLDGVDALDDAILGKLGDRHAEPAYAPGPDAEAGRIVAPLGDLVEDRCRLLPPPAERPAEVGGGQLAGVPEHERRELPAGGIALGSRFGSFHFRASRSWASVPQVLALVDEVRVREDELVVERGDRAVDLLLRQPGRVAELGPGHRPDAADRLDDGVGVLRRLAVRGDECRQEPRSDARDVVREMLADARQAAGRQLVLRPPEEVHLFGVPVGHLET